MLSVSLQKHLSDMLGAPITRITPVIGGDINQAYHVGISGDSLFVKVNSLSAFPAMFKREQEGLETLRATGSIGIPQVILQTDVGEESCLIMEWIEPGNVIPKSMELLGEQLAALHRSTQPQFGLNNSNYMGSLVQTNKLCNSFPEFFATQRLQPMVEMAISKGALSSSDAKLFDLLYNKLSTLIPMESPSFVHGDLWSGNYLISHDGKPYLIDPAVSFSHREVDIALTALFGGFSKEFYQAYQAAWPMESGWQERLPLWNLYPLLVHVNLFGGGYAEQVRKVLTKFV